MSAEAKENAELAMDEVMEGIRGRLLKIRTGKASPMILDGINVEYFGAPTPLNQLATVSAPEPRLLTVKPFDRSSINDIEKAIQAGNLGMNPSNDGMMIRLQIPELTQDRRKDFSKQAREMGEDGKIAIRKARQEANDILKAEEKSGDITEDELHRDKDAVQELTDKYCAQVDKVVATKQTEIMEL
jgi:ribosome recycling factor